MTSISYDTYSNNVFSDNDHDNYDDNDHKVKALYLVKAITSSRTIFVKVVHHLLVELRTQRLALKGGKVGTTNVVAARISIESQDSRPVTPDDNNTAPLTLLDMIAQSQIPGIKRKRSITHISSIAISSILPRPNPFHLTNGTTKSPTVANESAGSKVEGHLAVGVNGRAIVVRKRIGLGRLFSGLGVKSGEGGPRVVESDDEMDSDEDDDLIIIV